MTDEKKCVLCGCKDHKLFGCSKHFTKRCSCSSSTFSSEDEKVEHDSDD